MISQIKKKNQHVSMEFSVLPVICHTHKKIVPPLLAVDVQFLVHLRLAVAGGPQKCNSNCLKVLLASLFLTLEFKPKLMKNEK